MEEEKIVKIREAMIESLIALQGGWSDKKPHSDRAIKLLKEQLEIIGYGPEFTEG